VRSTQLLLCLSLGACSAGKEPAQAPRELIPAEWTVAEDTSATGDVTTLSLQLPSARQISGLAADEEPRLVLRCIDHRLHAFIDNVQADSSVGAEGDSSTALVPIELDSAPSCE
jgi:hypothetical protein